MIKSKKPYKILHSQVIKILKTASADYKKGRNLNGPFYTAEEMDKYLD